MSKKCLFSLLLSISIAVLPLAAQTHQETEVFAPFVTQLKGEATDSIVRLSWVDSQNARGPVYIYRSTIPFNRVGSPLRITPVEVPYGVQSFVDRIDTLEIPVEALYYFAAASGENGQNYNFHIISENLVTVQIPQRNTEDPPDQDINTEQLPLLYIPSDTRWVYIYPEPREVKVQGVFNGPRAFARDLEDTPASAEEYDLMSVVRGPFAERNWEEAGEELIRFLSLPIDPDTEGRARFYLGQCYYFLLQPWYGLFEFFAIHDRYPAETEEWIKASIVMMNE